MTSIYLWHIVDEIHYKLWQTFVYSLKLNTSFRVLAYGSKIKFLLINYVSSRNIFQYPVYKNGNARINSRKSRRRTSNTERDQAKNEIFSPGLKHQWATWISLIVFKISISKLKSIHNYIFLNLNFNAPLFMDIPDTHLCLLFPDQRIKLFRLFAIGCEIGKLGHI